MVMKQLEGKTAIVTGGAQGFGRAISLRLAKEGAFVCLFDIKSCDETVSLIEKNGGSVKAYSVNVANVNEINNAISQIIKERGVEILVNNSGVVTTHENLTTVSDEIWDKEIAVNLTGAFHCSRAVLEHMIQKQYGKIVNISSVAGATGRYMTSPAYAAAKAGIHGLTMSTAKSVAKHGINVNTIAPGPIVTGIHASYPQETIDKILNEIPYKRKGKPEDIANTVLFLVSDDSEFITGERIHVNGGAWMG